MSTIRGEVHIGGNTKQSSAVFEIKQAPGSAFYVVQHDDNQDHIGTLTAANPHYRFSLKRTSPSDPWVVTEVNTQPGGQDSSFPIDLSPAAFVQRSLHPPIVLSSSFVDLEWIALVNNPQFHLQSVAPIRQNGKELVEVEFSVAGSASAENLRWIKGGKATFDPALDWVMTACELQLDAYVPSQKAVFPETLVSSYEYRTGQDNFPMLTRMVAHEECPKEGYDEEKQAVCDLRQEDVPQSAFTLSAYGFPEPSKLELLPRWFWWAVEASVACFALALLCFLFFRRKAQKPAA